MEYCALMAVIASGNPWVAGTVQVGAKADSCLHTLIRLPSYRMASCRPTWFLTRVSLRVHRVDPSFTTLERKMIAFRITSVKEIAGDW